MNRALWVLAYALVALSSSTALADNVQLSLRTTTSATTVKRRETFQLDVIVTTNSQDPLDELALPDVSDFEVVGQRRGSESRVVEQQGSRDVVTEYVTTFALRATESGNKTIGEARARQRTAAARAAPIRIQVLPAAGDATPGDSDKENDKEVDGALPGARFGKNLPTVFVELRVEPREAYVGQQVTASAEVWSQLPLGQRPRMGSLNPPGFLCIPIRDEVQPQVTQRTLRGRTYYIYPLTRDALFALEPGEQSLAPITLDVSPAASFQQRSRALKVQSDAVTLQVKPLPPGGPAGAAVGNLTLTASVHPAATTVGQPVTLRLAASGHGSLDSLVIPGFAPDQEGVRVFPPTVRQERRDQDGMIAGSVVQEMLVQPTVDGELQIPAFSMPFFDPQQASWGMTTSLPLVVPVRAAPADAQSSTANHAAAGSHVIGEGPRPLRTGLSTSRRAELAPAAAVAGAAAALAGSAAAAILRRRRRRQESTANRRDAWSHELLRAGEQAIARGDLAGLERVLLEALSERAGPAVKSTPSAALAPLLESAGLPPALALRAKDAVMLAESARYAPGGTQSKRTAEMLALLRELVAAPSTEMQP